MRKYGWYAVFKDGTDEHLTDEGVSLYEILQIVKKLDNVDHLRYDSESVSWTHRGVI